MSNTPDALKSDFAVADEIRELLSNREQADQERVLRWVAESLGLGTVAHRPGKSSANANSSLSPDAAGPLLTSDRRPRVDIKSFIQEKVPKSDMQFATVVAYFFRFVAPPDEQKELLTSEDLQTAARQARGYAFKTASKTLNNAVQQGYLDRAGNGSYKINAVGENLVAMTLGTGTQPLGRASRSKVKKSIGKKNG